MTVTLHLGDCLDILPTLADKSVDAIITDIPYGTARCSWDTVIPFGEMWKHVRRLLTDIGVFVTTASQPFTSSLIMSNMEMYKYCWYFEKPKAANFASTKWQPLKVVEEIVVFGNGSVSYTGGASEGITFNPQKTELKKPYKRDFTGNVSKSPTTFLQNQNAGIVEYTHAQPRNILYAATDGDGREHPTQKPIALYEYLVKTYTNEGDTVLDFTMGSGTTGIACMNTGRNFIGVEKEPEYFEIAERRIRQAQEARQLELV